VSAPAEPASATLQTASEALGRLVRDVPDFPQPGVLFKDIGPVLGDPAGLRSVVHALAELAAGADGPPVDKVAGIEARGFLLAAPVGVEAGVGVVPVRKAGKLPGATHRMDYALEYGVATLEIQTDAIAPGERVLLIDDVLATGGTAGAAAALIAAAGGVVTEFAVLIEIAALGGRKVLDPLPVRSLLTV
jgi:adenine phosphoribosyltransferase